MSSTIRTRLVSPPDLQPGDVLCASALSLSSSKFVTSRVGTVGAVRVEGEGRKRVWRVDCVTPSGGTVTRRFRAAQYAEAEKS